MRQMCRPRRLFTAIFVRWLSASRPGTPCAALLAMIVCTLVAGGRASGVHSGRSSRHGALQGFRLLAHHPDNVGHSAGSSPGRPVNTPENSFRFLFRNLHDISHGAYKRESGPRSSRKLVHCVMLPAGT